jgi:hypothetical protein
MKVPPLGFDEEELRLWRDQREARAAGERRSRTGKRRTPCNGL